MFKGEYRFYRYGEMIAAHPNLITTAGRTHILKYMAGAVPQIGDSISVGIGETPATLLDRRLEYEVENQKLEQIGINNAESKLVFKVSLTPGIALKISEVGLWAFGSGASGYGASRSLSNADPVTENWLNAFWSPISRISLESLLLQPQASETSKSQFSTFNQDLSMYSNSDEFVVAYEADENIGSISLYFHTTDTDYYEATIINVGAGYKIGRVLKNDCVAVGNPSWSNVGRLYVGATATAAGAGEAMFDGLRIERNTNLDAASTLVSRSKLSSPVIKAVAEPLDIEYTVQFNL